VGRVAGLDLRPMSTGIHRAVELAIGSAMVGYCAYAIYRGEILGKFRVYSRSEHPWSFWAAVLITFVIGLAFLFGAVSWRN